MTHPLDRLYRFETPDQWGAGVAQGFSVGPTAGLSLPRTYRATRWPGSGRGDAGARLARDPGERLVWLRPDGTIWTGDGAVVLRLGTIAWGLASDANLFLRGQRTDWVAGGGDLVRLDTETGARLGSFRASGWRVASAVQDVCDGTIAVEIGPDRALRLRRIRADGATEIVATDLIAEGHVSAARSVLDDAIWMVDVPDQGPWRLIRADLSGAVDVWRFDQEDRPLPGSPVALAPDGGVLLVAQDGVRLLAAGPGRVGRATEPGTRPEDGCGLGRIHDLARDADGVVAATETGLWRLAEEDGAGPPARAVWLSPVLHSPLGERRGWQRADLDAVLPQGGEITVSARGFETLADADTALAAWRAGGDASDDTGWDGRSRHMGLPGGGPLACRHYLGEIPSEFLILRITVTVPARSGPAGLRALRVLYPDRSILEALPAIYRNGGRSERQMRRALAGFQATIDEIDDRISAAVQRADPATADDLWTAFLLHWLGHGELARLPSDVRRALLADLPEIMGLRGTLAGLTRVMEILAPGGFSIEDGGLAPDDWLLAAAGDPAGARLGRDTRAAHTAPVPLALGKCTALGAHVLGRGCTEAGSGPCSSDVVVRVPGGADRIGPFADAIARSFAPAHARLHFAFGAHDPSPSLGAAPPLGDLMLDSGGGRALGDWALPGAGTRADPEQDVVLGEATLDGTLTLE